jgi:hypothetical protein
MSDLEVKQAISWAQEQARIWTGKAEPAGSYMASRYKRLAAAATAWVEFEETGTRDAILRSAVREARFAIERGYWHPKIEHLRALAEAGDAHLAAGRITLPRTEPQG